MDIQTGETTVDALGKVLSDLLTETYPTLQSTNRLLHSADVIDDAVRGLRSVTGVEELDAVESRAKRAFEMTQTGLKRLSGRLRDKQGKADLSAIQQSFKELTTTALGSAGVFAAQAAVLKARAELAAGGEVLDRIERTYLGVLDGVVQAVGNLNQDARRNAGEVITTSRQTIGATVLLALIAALALGLFLANRITQPLQQLANHAVAIRASGELRPLPDARIVGASDEIGTLARSFNSMIDELESARKRLVEWSELEIRTQYERLNTAINNMPQGLCMFDREQKLIICNDRYAEIYGLPTEHTTPATPLETILRHRAATHRLQDDQQFVEERIEAVAQRKPWYHVSEFDDGRTIAVSHQPMPDGGSIATHEDITERRKAEAKIAHMAHHDALTDLPNRVYFRQQMEQALHSPEHGGALAVLCLDLDYFKTVNDTLGHPVGDALLRLVAKRLLACVRSGETVARLGGDEFAIIQPGSHQPADSTALSERVIEKICAPFDVNGHQIVIGASIGIAIAPADGSNADQLLKNADMALYRAKEEGRSTYRFFEAAMDARMQTRRAMELDLRKALALGEFRLEYQPLMTLANNSISQFEALIRWEHPERGTIPPGEFIPLTEEIGLIGAIGAWVLKEACTEAMKWPSDIKVAVNLSPVQFKHRKVVLDVIAALGASGLPANRLELEITESVLLQDTEATLTTLNELRDLGVRISMDDFGTGYSSLGYLRKFSFDKIKIDSSFVHDLSERGSVAIVRAVTGLGNSLGIEITAEGVETEEQCSRLRKEGCTEIQGFLISKPVPGHKLAALLKQHDRKAVA